MRSHLRSARPAAALGCFASVIAMLASTEHESRGQPAKPALAPLRAAGAAASCPPGMAALPGGTFTLGYTLGEPHGPVTLAPFCLDVTEVTVSAYGACVRTGQCAADHPGMSSFEGTAFMPDEYCNYGLRGRGNHPMNCVDWGQSATYCHAQGKRLPTEEEWEWAARGGSRAATYPWGDELPDAQLCWSGTQAPGGTCPVGSYGIGDAPGGIHDLSGNVWEWTSSKLEAAGAARVIRGGSWNVFAAGLVSAKMRRGYAPASRYRDVGFRCAR